MYKILVALLITSLLATGIAKASGYLFTTTRELQELTTENYNNARVEAILQEMIDYSDTHRLPMPPRVHKNGRITLTNGTVSSVLGHPKYAPRDSDAFTAISLSHSTILSVQRAASTGTAEICQYQFSESITAGDHFIGVTVDSVMEVVATAPIIFNAHNCALTNIISVPSMIASGNTHEPTVIPYIRVLIPIKELITIYVTDNDELRLLSHRGDQITENQPVLRGISRLNIRLISTSSNDHWSLASHILFPSGRRSEEIILSHLLQHRGLLNITLNKL